MGASSLLGSLTTVSALPPLQARGSPRRRQRDPWQKQLECTAVRMKESRWSHWRGSCGSFPCTRTHGRKQRGERLRVSGKHGARLSRLKTSLSPPQSPALCISFIISDDNDDWGFPTWNRAMRASAIPSYHRANELPVSAELIHELLLLLASPV